MSRCAPGKTVGHAAQRIEGLGGQRRSRHGLQIGRRITYPQSLGTGRVAQKAHHGQQLSRLRRIERYLAHLRRFNVARPLPSVVVHLEVVHALTAHFQRIALP